MNKENSYSHSAVPSRPLPRESRTGRLVPDLLDSDANPESLCATCSANSSLPPQVFGVSKPDEASRYRCLDCSESSPRPTAHPLSPAEVEREDRARRLVHTRLLLRAGRFPRWLTRPLSFSTWSKESNITSPLLSHAVRFRTWI